MRPIGLREVRSASGGIHNAVTLVLTHGIRSEKTGKTDIEELVNRHSGI
jgi:hypothetical protein